MSEPIEDPSDNNDNPQSPQDVVIKHIETVGESLIVRTNIGQLTCYRTTTGVYIPRRGGVFVDGDAPDPDPLPPDPTDPPPDPPDEDPTIYAAVNDYPYRYDAINTADPWLFYKRECVSFTCWRVRKRTPVTNFTNIYRGIRFGNAINWDNAARQVGFRVDSTPAVHSIAVRNSGKYGHVAYVRKVNTDGSYCTEEYNSLNDHLYHQYNPSSAGRFDSFIHFEDGPP
jgi:surface antigen